jgi:ATP-dependent exoDNAse (exonuclease V) alpha subunit
LSGALFAYSSVTVTIVFMKYTLSRDQAEALKAIGAWYKGRTAPYLTLGGFAGTGKTTLVAYMREAIEQLDDDLSVAFCAFTGKASMVLRNTLKAGRVARRQDNVSTIHSLIYDALAESSGVVHWALKEPPLGYDLIVVDEASMVDESIWADLLSFGIPVLAVGDHGQLPPVRGSFNLMSDPQLRLEQIFRQAEDSPIISVASLARTTGTIPVGVYGPGVVKLDRGASETGSVIDDMLEGWSSDLLVLCGYNHTRVKLNAAIRTRKGFESPEPQPGDAVVCLRNNRSAKLFNGLTGTIRSIHSADNDPDGLWYEAEIALDGETANYTGYILRAQFGEKEAVKDVPRAPDGGSGNLFDFGYCLTVHKSQGSQASSVLLFEERFPKMSDDDWRRWLYTAVTRASEQLTIVGV